MSNARRDSYTAQDRVRLAERIDHFAEALTVYYRGDMARNWTMSDEIEILLTAANALRDGPNALPSEPTDGMLSAGLHSYHFDRPWSIAKIYRAMVAAHTPASATSAGDSGAV